MNSKKQLLIDMLKSDASFVRQAIILNESLEVPLLTTEEIIRFAHSVSWDEDSVNWYLLEEFGGIGFEDVTNITIEKISTLPSSIGNLLSLESLELSRCGLSRLPDSIGNLHNLKFLGLDDSNLHQLPRSLQRLKNLEMLSLNCTEISIPAWLGKLPNFRILEMKDAHLLEIPPQIQTFTQLQRLNLIGNRISSIPDWLSKMPHLKELDLEHNLIVEFPEYIGRLRGNGYGEYR